MPQNQTTKLHTFPDRFSRNEHLEAHLDIKLESIKKSFADDDHLDKVHCENLIGGVSVPVGVAGEVEYFSLQNEKKCQTYIPLATTEGALVASVSRGCKAINESGGAISQAVRKGVTRGPVFFVGSIEKGVEFKNWLLQNETKIKQVLESTSNHLKYLKMDITPINQYVYIRFHFNSGNAMGMNMATIAVTKLTEFVQQEAKVNCITVSGNYCVDKKPSWQNFINGRGFVVQSEVVLTQETIQKTLKTTAADMFEVWLSKCMLGSAMSGSLGFNLHFANVAAAFFVATGQDLAQVVEASHGVTTCKAMPNGSLYIGIFMPCVLVATVGGGTKLNCQRENLNMLKVTESSELAEILGTGVLAGEISLLASQAAGTLATSHAKLGR